MRSDWASCLLGDVVNLKRGYDLPSRLRETGDVPLISSSGFSDTHNQSKVKGPGVVTGRYGTIGNVFFSEKDFWPLNTTLYVQDFKNNDEKFIYYFLKTLRFSDFSDKAAVPGVNRNHLHMAEVSIPLDVNEQKAIAHVLGTLDDKIDLNRQINHTLESMAQALFKSWFVDFDPVIDNALAAGNPIPDALKAKAAQRAEQLKAATQSGAPPVENRELFPSEFAFTEELGWIPKGWHVLGFEDLAEAKQGKYLSSDKMKSLKDDEYAYPVWGGNEIRGYSKKFTFEEPSVILTCRGSNCGLIKITDSESWVTNSSFACLPKVGSAYFVYLYFLNENFSSVVSGSAQPQITFMALKNKIMKYPISNQVVEDFSEQVYLLRRKAILNMYKIKSLSSLRDTLLPKLLSGELRIADAAALVEGV